VPPRPITRLLIANRGEIAVRIARACRDLGILPVAVASEADRGALHTRVAAETVPIGPAPAAESYLRIDRLIAAAVDSRCEAIHPGYGFLAQNADFAEAVERAGLVFVGPGPAALRLMGDKMAARRAMTAAGVPVIPGWEGTGEEENDVLRREADRIGYPVLVKAAGGGGGRGMRVVVASGDLESAVESARRESQKAFGDGRLFLERVIEDARHVEVQVLADARGECIHLFERECSIQRRFQKIVEESPSPVLDEALRMQMGRSAVAAARACGYVNAGTIEFLVDPGRGFFFLEMNTRIQVEHPVTEMVTGVDLVQAQIRIASGDPLPARQDELTQRGHAIECRVNAEDPGREFAPSSGPVLLASFPSGPGIRVDAGVATGDRVTPYYDSLVAKIIVHAPDRPAALERMEEALGRTTVLGVETNIPYLRAILAHPVFRSGGATTMFTGRELAAWRPPESAPSDEVLVVAAVVDALRARTEPASVQSDPEGEERDRHSPWDRGDGFRTGAM
jgi:acetyl-CoA carboxylase biotin carboxylase subunit